MALEQRSDIFDPGDITALVCVDNPDLQPTVIDHLASLEYKIHVGLFTDDVLLKLRSHPYDVIVVSENFGSTPLSANPVIATAIHLPADQRRRQFICLIGPDFVTNDEMLAFILSVDLVINDHDLLNLKPVLRRGVSRHKEFYQSFYDTIKSSSMA
jgi:hypothetical protein